ncbi:iron complex transport system permease protein [Rhizobium rosettiformans]|uniref:Iron complex transport system permease protein n=1 Tax=Rhizobium rosettiformans TaxID=1368430 RepID=A0A7W8HS35_9HYPH|nr:iron ABC transporter permease [Rhizobium rosettiformans]MBB5277265.1 iron complex transport system permease protein [Rhizobium rosettiformans]
MTASFISTSSAATQRFAASRRSDLRKRRLLLGAMTLAIAAIVFASLVIGRSLTPPADVIRVLLGEAVPGASFTVGQLRLPRALTALAAGMSFGLGGAAFQTMLRNPLASPDIIGISSGASAAAVFAIVVLSMSGPAVSILAIAAGLGVAILVYGLSARDGVAGPRLILVGIGVSAMLESIIAYVLTRAPGFTLQEALRWLTGSLNGAQMEQLLPLLLSLIVFGGILFMKAQDLEAMRAGEETAAALGVNVGLVRILVIVSAVGLIATATAVTGPIAFVAFLTGPIAARTIGRRGSILLPSALVGAGLVLIGDLVGQFLLPGRYPVGVVTGALGAPYLILLIISVNRAGGKS